MLAGWNTLDTLDYRPIGGGGGRRRRTTRRRTGRSLKRLLDGYNREAETCHSLALLRDQEKMK